MNREEPKAQRKLEFDRKAKEKWANVSDTLVGTTQLSGQVRKKTARRKRVGGEADFCGGQNEELHARKDKAARREKDGAAYYFVQNMSDEPQTVRLPYEMEDLWNGISSVDAITLPPCGSAVLKSK